MPKVKKILVLRNDHLGDCILTFPLFEVLKKQGKLTVLTRSNNKQILEENKNIDKIISLNTPWFARGDNGGWSKVIKFIFKNFRKYDLVIEPHGDPLNIILAFFISKYRVGFGVRGLGFLLNNEVKWDGKKHIVEKMLDLAGACGYKSKNPEIILPKLKSDKINRIIKKIGAKKKKLIIAPGVGAYERDWGIDNFIKLIKLIKKKYPKLSIILVDKNNLKTKQISEKVKGLVDLGGKLSIKELITLVSKSNYVISLESATMHIASGYNVQVIDIHSTVTRPWEWGPYSKKAIIIGKYKNENMDKRKAQNLMRKIKPETVFNEFKKLF